MALVDNITSGLLALLQAMSLLSLVNNITSCLLALLQAMSLLLVVLGSSALMQIDQKGHTVQSHENYQAIFRMRKRLLVA